MQKNSGKSQPKTPGLVSNKLAQAALGELKGAVAHLIALCQAFDLGHEGVVGELTRAVLAIVHDTTKAPGHLTLTYTATGDLRFNKLKMLFKNTCMQLDPKHPPAELHFVMANSKRYLAPLGEATTATLHREGFDPWWLKRPVWLEPTGDRLSRRELVQRLAHAVPGPDGPQAPDLASSQAYASIRQIAHELLVSFERLDPALVQAYLPPTLAERAALAGAADGPGGLAGSARLTPPYKKEDLDGPPA